jgi:hypothetical protein
MVFNRALFFRASHRPIPCRELYLSLSPSTSFIVVELDNEISLWHNEMVRATESVVPSFLTPHSDSILYIFYLPGNGFHEIIFTKRRVSS